MWSVRKVMPTIVGTKAIGNDNDIVMLLCTDVNARRHHESATQRQIL
jgi:hypothetical protein